MLDPPAKTKRFLELTQVLLTFISVCAVAEASGIGDSPAERPGFHARLSEHDGAARDRRFADLARVERKRREAEQRAYRRSGTLALVAGATAAKDGGIALISRVRAPEADRPCIPVFAQAVAFRRHYHRGEVPEEQRFQQVAVEPHVACELQLPARPAQLE